MHTLNPAIAPALLEWFSQNKRALPFRQGKNPYHIWVSEIMLQQTRMNAALPYYQRFVQQLPTVQALAECDEETLHKLWEGLGYYSRARNLQKAARLVVQQYGGHLPASFEELKTLPGIGPYTAGAIASIAFGLPVVAVDGNVLRVMARLGAVKESIGNTAVKKQLSAMAQSLLPPQNPGDYNEALMELGALVCLPGTPQCGACPLAACCQGLQQGIAQTLPVMPPKIQKQTEEWSVLVVRCGKETLLQRRPQTGLLAGLWQPMLLPGRHGHAALQKQLNACLPGAALQGPLGPAKHIFTHKIWQMEGWLCRLSHPALPPDSNGWRFACAEEIQTQYTIPGAFRAFLPAILGEENL